MLSRLLSVALLLLVCLGTGQPQPSTKPTQSPTYLPGFPTPSPSALPTPAPTWQPTANPTNAPTPRPTSAPTPNPSPVPTLDPTRAPTYLPGAPTALPTLAPTAAPSPKPTASSQPTTAVFGSDPAIVSWSLSISTGQIVLVFDTPINAASFKPARMSIISVPSSSYPWDTAVFVTGYKAESFMGRDMGDYDPKQNYTSVTFYLLKNDYSALMYNPTTANTNSSSYLVARQGLVSTRSGRPSKEITQVNALRVSTFVPDTNSPVLLSGGLDYNLGRVTLIFSEPIGPSGKNGNPLGQVSMSGLAVQTASGCSQYGPQYFCQDYVEFEHTNDIYQVNVTDYAQVITYYIGETNINALKRIRGVADGVSNTFFSVWRPICNDSNGNPMTIYGAEMSNGIQATFFTPDTQPPFLKDWIYDCAAGAVRLVFNKPIDPDYFNYSAITILSSPDISSVPSPVFVRINDLNSDIINRQTEYNETLTIQFTQSKLDSIFSNVGILSSPLNSYLILDKNAVVDTASVANIYQGLDATRSKPKRVSIFAPDTIQPQIVSAKLDMSSQLMTLTFTKVMNVSTINLLEISIQTASSSKLATAQRFSSDKASLASQINSKEVVFKLSSLMFSIMKQLSIGTSQANSFIYFSSKFIADRTVLANRVVNVDASAALRISTYVPDQIKPYVSSWYADMSLEKLIITFSEPVDFSNNAQYIDVRSITLHDDSVITLASVSFTLTLDSVVSGISSDGSTIYIQLSSLDAAKIKTQVPLCKSRDRCFLSHTSTLARDLATYDPGTGSAIVNQIAPASLIPSSAMFIVDTFPPALTSYTFSNDNGNGFAVLELTFTEPVMCQFLNPAGLILRRAANISSSTVTLSASTFSPDTNALVAKVLLSSYDYIRLKMAKIGSTGVASFFLRVTSEAVRDIAGNSISGIKSNVQYLAPLQFLSDIRPPSLVALSLSEMKTNFSSSANLTIYFDDVVEIKSLSLSHFVIFSTASGNKVSMASTKVLSVKQAAAVVIYFAPAVYTNFISAGLLDSQVDTNLYIDRDGSVYDLPMLNSQSRMTVSSGVRLGQRFLSFRFDLANKFLYATTAYPMDAASVWDPTQTFLGSVSSGVNVPFAVADSFKKISVDTALFTISTGTINRFKESIPFDEASNLVMTFGEKSFADSRRNFLFSSHQIICVQLLADTVPPILTSFFLDLGTGTITLTMSKVVQVSLVNLGYLRLQSSLVNGTNTVTRKLSNGVVLTSSAVPSSVIVISLNRGTFPTIRDTLNLQSKLGKSISNTFLSIGKGFVGDTAKAPNYMLPVVVQADSVTLDTIKPQLKSWSIDLTAHILAVTYNEAISPKSNIARDYLLLRDPAVPSVYEMFLSSSQTNTSIIGNTVYIELSQDDLNNMYRMTPNLCTKGDVTLNGGNCFLSIKQNAITDIVGNGIAGVIHVFATLPPSKFKRDATPPVLTNYTFSLQDGFADFFFDKVVDCQSVNMNQLVWQYSAFLGTTPESYQMTESAPDCTKQPRYDTHFHVDFALTDLTLIKTFSRLFKKHSYGYARPQSGFVLDTFGNSILTLQDGSALQVGEFFPDTVNPRLISFTISSSKEVYMFFTEPIQLSTMSLAKVMFSDYQWPATKFRWNLVASVVRTSDVNKMQVIVTLGSDYTMMAANSPIFNYQINTLLSFTRGFATDTSGNPITIISNSSALKYGPSILTWDLDLMTGRMVMTFPEAMLNPFSPVGIGIQPIMSASGSTKIVSITTPDYFRTLDAKLNTSFAVDLSSYDLNAIKFHRVAVSSSFAYLNAPFGISSSAFVGTLLPNLKTVARPPSVALQVRFLTADAKAPVIQSFFLNLNTRKMYILIDEPVLLTSFVLPGFTLVSDKGSYATLTAPSGTNIKVRNMTQVVLSLCTRDLNYIKLAYKIGALDRLVVAKTSFADLASNPYAGNTQDFPILSTVSQLDTLPPVFQNASLNLATGILALTFDEIVNMTTVNTTQIYIGSTSDFKSAIKYRLTHFSIVDQLSDWTVTVDLKTYRIDLSSLVSTISTGTDVSNTFIFINHVQDIFGNEMTTRSVVQAASVVPNLLPLSLVAFDYFAATKSFTLHFNKEVALSSFNCSDFTVLSSASSSPNAALRLRMDKCSSVLTGYSSHVTFNYSGTISANICDTYDSCFVSVPTTGTTQDISNGRLSSLSAESAMQAGVQLENALVDMNNRVVTLVFSKNVILNSFVPSNLGFYSSVTESSFYLQSTSSTALAPLSIVPASTTQDNKGTFLMSVGDANLLKALDVQPGNLFIITKDGTMNNGAIRDVRGIKIAAASIALNRDYSQIVSKIVMDNVAPLILKVTTSIGRNLIRIDFNEPIRATSVIVSNLVFQSTSSSSAVSYKLTAGSVVSSGNSVNITLSTADSEAIKLTKGLLKSMATSFLSFAFKTVADYAGNSVATVKTTSAFSVAVYIPDTVPPTLVKFSLDMTSTQISLFFSEPVRADLFDPTQIVLQSRSYSNDGAAYNLTGGRLLNPDSSTIKIQLSAADVFNIKNTKGLCRSQSSTFLVLSPSATTDIAGNPVVAIRDRLAQLVNTFTTDTVPPTVTKIVVDTNAGHIYVHFSDLVQLLLVVTRGMTVYSSTLLSAVTTQKVTLTAASTVEMTGLYSNVVQVNLGSADFDTIKYRFPLFRSLQQSVFVITSDFAQDTFFNPMVAITTPALANAYVSDTKPPTMLSYSLDMVAGLVTLKFSESMQATSLDMSQFTVQTTRLKRFGTSILLTGSVATVGKDQLSSTVTMQLSVASFINMKYLAVGKTVAAGLLSWTDKAIADQFGNYLPPNWDASISGFVPRTPESYAADSASPMLVRWQLDRIEMKAYLYFDEPVAARNLTLTLYTDSTGGHPQSLTPGIAQLVNSTSNTIIILVLKDFCAWSSLDYKCTVPKPGAAVADMGFFQVLKLGLKDKTQKLFLSARAGAFVDFANIPNPSMEILAKTPLREGSSDCSDCPDGQFASKLCTPTTDRVCSPCSSCTAGSFLVSTCSAVANTICKPCSACPFNTYVSQVCSLGADAVCSPCTLCSASEYEVQKCELGKNTRCTSCLMCTFPDQSVQQRCENGPWVWWQMDNCCFSDEGVATPCNILDVANMLISVINSKHNWVLPGTTTPAIVGDQYALK